eukprot:TRINITY_DN12988_c0_g2_i1.p1 TRINITY_DN12988_c0_g2~~TRINITY_DN12988_c0_g2_i1.p1  ORF type:complete len:151 (+),score=19.93 TRINITY_DN12988_c0_g2_i1:565-1017(+)
MMLERITQYKDTNKKKYYEKYNKVMRYYMTEALNRQEPEVNGAILGTKLKPLRWALKKYLCSINSKEIVSPNSINLLLSIRRSNKMCDRSLFDAETVRRARDNLVKRELVVHSLGKKILWKPPKYLPPKGVVLANSIEELEHLYKTNKQY